MSAEAAATAAARLDHEGYLDVEFYPGGVAVGHATLTWPGLLTWLKATGVDVNDIGQRLAVHLVNTDDRDLETLAAAVEQPTLIVDLVLESLEQQDLIGVSRSLGGGVEVDSVSPALRPFVE